MKIQRNDPPHSVQNSPIVPNRENGHSSIQVSSGSTPKGDSFVSVTNQMTGFPIRFGRI